MDKKKPHVISLEGKVVDAEELVSMIKAQTAEESEDVVLFASRIIGLIYSHAEKAKNEY